MAVRNDECRELWLLKFTLSKLGSSTNRNCICLHEIGIFFSLYFVCCSSRCLRSFSHFRTVVAESMLWIPNRRRTSYERVRKKLRQTKVMANSYTDSSREMLNQNIICSIRLLANVFGRLGFSADYIATFVQMRERMCRLVLLFLFPCIA